MKNKKDEKTGRFLNQLNNLNKNDIILKYEELKTFQAVAKEFNITSESIRQYFIKNNIPYKKKTRYICDDNFFSRDNEESFYWAGFMAADGNVSKNNDISINLKYYDFEHIEKFKKAIKSDAKITKQIHKKSTYIMNGKMTTFKETENAVIKIRSNKMAKNLERFNILPNKTKTYNIPDWLMNHKLFRHFIRGYFDGDGYFSKHKTHNKYLNDIKIKFGLCGNLSVLEIIKINILNNCEIKGKPDLRKHINIWQITFQDQYDVVNIINYLYKNTIIYLDRKYELSRLALQLTLNLKTYNLDKNELEAVYNKLKSIQKNC